MKRTAFILLLLVAALLLPCAHAENAQADLQARFGGRSTLEYEGQAYAVKSRTDTLLFAAYEGNALQLAYIIAVDDEADRIAPIRVISGTEVPACEDITLARIFAQDVPSEDPSVSQADADSRRLLAAVNSLFPDPLIESYLFLDVNGLALLDGGGDTDPALSDADNTKARLKAIAKEAVNASNSQLMDMMELLSPHLATDVKTGTLVNMADKARRYEVVSTMVLPGYYPQQDADSPQDADILPIPMDTPREPNFTLDQDALTELLVEYFYNISNW